MPVTTTRYAQDIISNYLRIIAETNKRYGSLEPIADFGITDLPIMRIIGANHANKFQILNTIGTVYFNVNTSNGRLEIPNGASLRLYKDAGYATVSGYWNADTGVIWTNNSINIDTAAGVPSVLNFKVAATPKGVVGYDGMNFFIGAKDSGDLILDAESNIIRPFTNAVTDLGSTGSSFRAIYAQTIYASSLVGSISGSINLTNVNINTTKDWLGYGISNVGTIYSWRSDVSSGANNGVKVGSYLNLHHTNAGAFPIIGFNAILAYSDIPSAQNSVVPYYAGESWAAMGLLQIGCATEEFSYRWYPSGTVASSVNLDSFITLFKLSRYGVQIYNATLTVNTIKATDASTVTFGDNISIRKVSPQFNLLDNGNTLRAYFSNDTVDTYLTSNYGNLRLKSNDRHVVSDNTLAPLSGNVYDLGVSTSYWKDLYLQGIAHLGTDTIHVQLKQTLMAGPTGETVPMLYTNRELLVEKDILSVVGALRTGEGLIYMAGGTASTTLRAIADKGNTLFVGLTGDPNDGVTFSTEGVAIGKLWCNSISGYNGATITLTSVTLNSISLGDINNDLNPSISNSFGIGSASRVWKGIVATTGYYSTILFGTLDNGNTLVNLDVNLYRSAANILTTDDSFTSPAINERGQLSNGTDWNTKTTVGVYGVVPGALQGGTFGSSNYPAVEYMYGHLVVSKHSADGIQQSYYAHAGGQSPEIWVRTGWNSSGFQNWGKVITNKSTFNSGTFTILSDGPSLLELRQNSTDKLRLGHDLTNGFLASDTGDLILSANSNTIRPSNNSLTWLGSPSSRWKNFYWGQSYLSDDQGGAIELGESSSTTALTPFIDFHYGVGSAQDYNMRLINDGNRQLSIQSVTANGTLRMNSVDLSLTSSTILFGGDTNLYRAGANSLMTDDNFISYANVSAYYLIKEGTYAGINSSPMLGMSFFNKDMFVDALQYLAPNTYETYNGSTWASEAVPTDIFVGKKIGNKQIIFNSVQAIRFTWTNFSYHWFEALYTYVSSARNTISSVLIQKSNNGTTWEDVYTSGSISGWPTHSIIKAAWNNTGSYAPYLRITYTFNWNMSYTDNINFYNIRYFCVYPLDGQLEPFYQDYNRKTYFNGNAQIGTLNVSLLDDISAGSIGVNATIFSDYIIPKTTDTYDLGASGTKWNRVYANTVTANYVWTNYIRDGAGGNNPVNFAAATISTLNVGTIVGYNAATALSAVSIDVAKNWGGYGISNLGTLTLGADVTLFRENSNWLGTDDDVAVKGDNRVLLVGYGYDYIRLGEGSPATLESYQGMNIKVSMASGSITALSIPTTGKVWTPIGIGVNTITSYNASTVNFTDNIAIVKTAPQINLNYGGTLKAFFSHDNTDTHLESTQGHLHLKAPSGKQIALEATLVPLNANTYDNGATTSPWRDIWLQSTLHFGNDTIHAYLCQTLVANPSTVPLLYTNRELMVEKDILSVVGALRTGEGLIYISNHDSPTTLRSIYNKGNTIFIGLTGDPNDSIVHSAEGVAIGKATISTLNVGNITFTGSSIPMLWTNTIDDVSGGAVVFNDDIHPSSPNSFACGDGTNYWAGLSAKLGYFSTIYIGDDNFANFDCMLRRGGANIITTTDSLYALSHQVWETGTGNWAFVGGVNGYSQPSIIISNDGVFNFSDGNTFDVSLYRDSPGRLRTASLYAEQYLAAGNCIYSIGSTNSTWTFASQLQGEAGYRIIMSGGGTFFFGDGAGGYDVNLYRNGANDLKTDDFFTALGGIGLGTSSTIQWWGGAGWDTNITRASAGMVNVTNGISTATITVSGRFKLPTSAPASPQTGDMWVT